MLHLTPNQPSACPESGTLGTVVRQDVRHNKRPAHTDWRNTDGWDLQMGPRWLPPGAQAHVRC